MACSTITLSSIDARCDKGMGGIKRVLVANTDDVTGVTLSSTDGLITAISLASGKKFVEYRFRKETGSYTSTIEVDTTLGNSFAKTDVALQFSKAEAVKRLAIQSAINANAVLILEDMEGQYIYLGFDFPVEITNAVMQSGTAMGDLNGFTLTFSDTSRELPHFIKTGDGGVDIDSLLA